MDIRGGAQQSSRNQENVIVPLSSLHEQQMTDNTDPENNHITIREVDSTTNELDRDPWYLRQFNMYRSQATETTPTIQENGINENPQRTWNCRCFIIPCLLIIALCFFIYGLRQ